MTTDNKGAINDGWAVRLAALLAECKPSYSDVGSRDVETTTRRNAIDEAIALLAAQPAQAVAEAVDEDAAFKQWMMWHHDYDLCLTDECRKSARAGWDARARLGVIAAQPAPAGYSIRHVDGRWRTLDTSGMPDWTDEQAKALCFSLRAHADLYAQDDPEDVRIIEVAWSAKP